LVFLETKPKRKEYKTLLYDAIKNDNFDREIKLKKEIETMVYVLYALYGLSEDEIGIVEGRE